MLQALQVTNASNQKLVNIPVIIIQILINVIARIASLKTVLYNLTSVHLEMGDCRLYFCMLPLAASIGTQQVSCAKQEKMTNKHLRIGVNPWPPWLVITTNAGMCKFHSKVNRVQVQSNKG